MNDKNNFLDKAEHELTAAYKTLEEAEYLANGYYYHGAANRLYYSMFHAVSALFSKDALKSKTHKGSHVLFMREYVFQNKMSEDYSKLYSQLQTVRESSDYDSYYLADKNLVIKSIQMVKDFLIKISDYKGIVNKAVEAVYERTISSNLRSFTPEQLNAIKDYAAKADDQIQLKNYLNILWSMTTDKIQINSDNIPKEWKEDAYNELLDLTEGKVRGQSQGWKL